MASMLGWSWCVDAYVNIRAYLGWNGWRFSLTNLTKDLIWCRLLWLESEQCLSTFWRIGCVRWCTVSVPWWLFMCLVFSPSISCFCWIANYFVDYETTLWEARGWNDERDVGPMLEGATNHLLWGAQQWRFGQRDVCKRCCFRGVCELYENSVYAGRPNRWDEMPHVQSIMMSLRFRLLLELLRTRCWWCYALNTECSA